MKRKIKIIGLDFYEDFGYLNEEPEKSDYIHHLFITFNLDPYYDMTDDFIIFYTKEYKMNQTQKTNC